MSIDLAKYKTPPCMICPVREISVFSQVSYQVLEEINVKKRVIAFKRKQTIFQENALPNGLHIVHYGKVKMTKINSLGIEQIIGFARQGDIFGYDSLLSNRDYHMTATAMEDSIICFIPKENVLDLIKKDGQFTLRLMEKGFTQFTEIANNYSNMVHKPLRQKVAQALIHVMEVFGLDDQQTLGARLSREELANLALTTTASSIRTLSDFNKEGIIALEGKEIRIIDPTTLKLEADRY